MSRALQLTKQGQMDLAKIDSFHCISLFSVDPNLAICRVIPLIFPASFIDSFANSKTLIMISHYTTWHRVHRVGLEQKLIQDGPVSLAAIVRTKLNDLKAYLATFTPQLRHSQPISHKKHCLGTSFIMWALVYTLI